MANEIQALLETAILSLVEEGKEPSTALIKSRLTQPVPMPVIISALQSWKRTRKVPGYTQVKPQENTEQRVAQLEARTQSLEAQVKALTEQLALLQQNNG